MLNIDLGRQKHLVAVVDLVGPLVSGTLILAGYEIANNRPMAMASSQLPANETLRVVIIAFAAYFIGTLVSLAGDLIMATLAVFKPFLPAELLKILSDGEKPWADPIWQGAATRYLRGDVPSDPTSEQWQTYYRALQYVARTKNLEPDLPDPIGGTFAIACARTLAVLLFVFSKPFLGCAVLLLWIAMEGMWRFLIKIATPEINHNMYIAALLLQIHTDYQANSDKVVPR